MEYARSKSPQRYDNLLLIAALVLFVLWCMGYAATQSGYQDSLQANTVRDRNVLSIIYIGREVVDDPCYKIDDKLILVAMENIADFIFHIDGLE